MTAGRRVAEHLWIVGPGRAGLALGLLLHRAGAVARLTFSGRRPSPPDHPLLRGSARYHPTLAAPDPAPDAVVLAVPDGALSEVARALAGATAGALPPGVPVLHLSGALGTEVLSPLAARGNPVGSLHPLAALPDADRGAERLRGAWYAVEGDAAARYLAEAVVCAAGGRVLEVDPGGKALYHAAAVFASNYVVVLMDAAERLMGGAGVEAHDARAALSALAEGALADAAAAGPAAALTGPVARGDADTVARHLARLSPPDRALYSSLGRAALDLARRRGPEPAHAARVEQMLKGES